MIKWIPKVPKTAQSTPNTGFQVTKTHIPQSNGQGTCVRECRHLLRTKKVQECQWGRNHPIQLIRMIGLFTTFADETICTWFMMGGGGRMPQEQHLNLFWALQRAVACLTLTHRKSSSLIKILHYWAWLLPSGSIWHLCVWRCKKWVRAQGLSNGVSTLSVLT